MYDMSKIRAVCKKLEDRDDDLSLDAVESINGMLDAFHSMLYAQMLGMQAIRLTFEDREKVNQPRHDYHFDKECDELVEASQESGAAKEYSDILQYMYDKSLILPEDQRAVILALMSDIALKKHLDNERKRV